MFNRFIDRMTLRPSQRSVLPRLEERVWIGGRGRPCGQGGRNVLNEQRGLCENVQGRTQSDSGVHVGQAEDQRRYGQGYETRRTHESAEEKQTIDAQFGRHRAILVNLYIFLSFVVNISLLFTLDRTTLAYVSIVLLRWLVEMKNSMLNVPRVKVLRYSRAYKYSIPRIYVFSRAP